MDHNHISLQWKLSDMDIIKDIYIDQITYPDLPSCMSSSATSRCPSWLAWCRAVKPSQAVALISQPTIQSYYYDMPQKGYLHMNHYYISLQWRVSDMDIIMGTYGPSHISWHTFLC